MPWDMYIRKPKSKGPKPSVSARMPFMAPSASPCFDGGTLLCVVCGLCKVWLWVGGCLWFVEEQGTGVRTIQTTLFTKQHPPPPLPLSPPTRNASSHPHLETREETEGYTKLASVEKRREKSTSWMCRAKAKKVHCSAKAASPDWRRMEDGKGLMGDGWVGGEWWCLGGLS